MDSRCVLDDQAQYTAVRWTPFAGRTVYGRIEQVILRGEVVYAQGRLLAQPGSGRVLFQ